MRPSDAASRAISGLRRRLVVRQEGRIPGAMVIEVEIEEADPVDLRVSRVPTAWAVPMVVFVLRRALRRR